jgi:hypothetical protein
VPPPENNHGPPRRAEGAPIQWTDTPPGLTPPVDDLTKSARQPVHGSSRGKFLLPQHRRELEMESAIDPEVIAERGYESITRLSRGDQRQRERLNR